MNLRATVPWFLFWGMLSSQSLGLAQQSPSGQQPRQAGTPASASRADSIGPSKIDPAKEAAIRQLLDLDGGTAALNKLMDGMESGVKSEMANLLPPGEYRQKLIDFFSEKFRSSANPQQLLDQTTQIYDKYLSLDDVKGLIQFYSTPLGRKTLTVLPQVTLEVQRQSTKWGENLGRQTMHEVLTEHPDLANALVEAQRKSQTK